MELFGYLCSPLCKAKAASHGLKIPVYEGQKDIIEAKKWSKVRNAGWVAGTLLVLLLAAWFWYAWFGCQPRVVFSLRFADPAYSGQSMLAGKDNTQLVFLHGTTLGRCDLRSKKTVWSRDLRDDKEIESELRRRQTAARSPKQSGGEVTEDPPRTVTGEDLKSELEREFAAALSLFVRDENVWVECRGRLTRYDWKTGQELQTVSIPLQIGDLVARKNQVLAVCLEGGTPVIAHLDLLTGNLRNEPIEQRDSPGSTNHSLPEKPAGKSPLGGLPINAPANEQGGAMDPAKVAAQAQKLSYAERVALPALLGSSMNQQRVARELADTPDVNFQGVAPQTVTGRWLIPDQDGFVDFSIRLVESRIVTRSAMKPAPSRSALDGEITAGKSMELSNEMVNDMQRANGGDIVREDHSRYQVTLRHPSQAGAWTGEVIGPATLFPLRTVDVLTSDKQIMVFDKTGRKLWQSAMAFNVVGDLSGLDEQTATYGLGPCVERGTTLYVFDQGVLNAFELTSGQARWRFPSVGIMGLLFDDANGVYVNTTSATHESLKYSRQIDLSHKVQSIITRLDTRNGKILWSIPSRGLVNFVSGNIVLIAQASIPDERPRVDAEQEHLPWLKIQRIKPGNGGEVWEHFQQRAPLDMSFDSNSIRLVFKREVQVLRFPRW